MGAHRTLGAPQRGVPLSPPLAASTMQANTVGNVELSQTRAFWKGSEDTGEGSQGQSTFLPLHVFLSGWSMKPMGQLQCTPVAAS